MRARNETLSAASAALEQALAVGANPTPGWAVQVEDALSRVERAAHRQDAGLYAPTGGAVDIDSSQTPSPGLQRRLDSLHDDLGSLQARARTLQGLARHAPERTAAVDLHRHAAALLDAVRRYEREEARLILDSVTVEVGAGD